MLPEQIEMFCSVKYSVVNITVIDSSVLAQKKNNFEVLRAVYQKQKLFLIMDCLSDYIQLLAVYVTFAIVSATINPLRLHSDMSTSSFSIRN